MKDPNKVLARPLKILTNPDKKLGIFEDLGKNL